MTTFSNPFIPDPENVPAETTPYIFASLLAGLEVDPFYFYLLNPDYYLAAVTLHKCPDLPSRRQALDQFFFTLPGVDQFRAALARIDPTRPLPGLTVPYTLPDQLFADPPAEMPPLPPAAAVPPEWSWSDPDSFWLKEYLACARATAPMSDKYFHLAVGLFILSTAVARRVCLPVAAHTIYPNLYQLIIAPSTIHHKTTAIQLGLTLIQAARLDLLLLPHRQTPESFLAELSPHLPPTFSTWSPAERQRWLAERACSAQRGWLIDEASPLFDSLPRFLPLLLSLYECPDREVIHTLARGRQAVSHAYLSFLAAATPDAIAPHLAAPANWTNGLWARFILIVPHQAEPTWQFFPPAIPTPQPLIDQLYQLAFTALPALIPFPNHQSPSPAPGQSPRPQQRPSAQAPECTIPSPLLAALHPSVQPAWEAYARATSHDLLLQGGLDRRLWASYGRLHIIAIKIAILLATSDWAAIPPASRPPAPTIQLAHWHRAQALTEAFRANLHFILPDNPTSAHREEKILRLLKRAGERGLTLRELRQHSHLPYEEVVRQLSRLTKECVIDQYASPNRKTTYYHLNKRPAG